MKKRLKISISLIVVLLIVSVAVPITVFGSSGQASEAELKVMSFNVRYANESDESPNTWVERSPLIQQVIEREQPDIIGTQEALYPQVMDMDARLANYDWIGQGREGGSQGEYMAIFYNEDRFTPLEYDHFWLSDTPNVVGSATWGNNVTRMVTWVKFHDTKTDQQFYFMNTHFDHESEEARINSAKLISEKVKQFKPGLPVILTGDFNTTPGSEPYEILMNEGSFVDTWVEADQRINEGLGTYSGFEDPTGGGPENRIDWILSKGNVTTETSEIMDGNKDGQYPSDHYPVVSELTVAEEVSIEQMQKQIDKFSDDGAIANEQTARQLQANLESIKHFAETGKMDKAIEHMNDFKELLEVMQEHELFSGNAYEILNAGTDGFIEQWEEASENEKA